MTNINEQQFAIPKEKPHSGMTNNCCNQKQQWLAAWEKAYLQNEPDVSKPEKSVVSSSIDQAKPKPKSIGATTVVEIVANDKTLTNSIEQSIPSQNLGSIVSAQNEVNGNSTTKQLGSSIDVSVAQSSMPISRSSKGITSLQLAEKPVAQPKKFDMQTFRIASSGDEVSIWMRDIGLSQNKGQQIIENLRSILLGFGLKLASLTVNGENVYSKNQHGANSSKLGRDESGSINKIM